MPVIAMHAASVFSKNLQAECCLGFVLHCFSFVIAEGVISNKNLLVLSVLQKPVNREEFPSFSSKQKSFDTGCRNPPAVFSYLIGGCSEDRDKLFLESVVKGVRGNEQRVQQGEFQLDIMSKKKKKNHRS